MDLCPPMLRTIGNSAFRNTVTSGKDNFAKFLAEHRTSLSLIRKKFCKVIFSDVKKFVRNAGLPMAKS